MGLVRAWVFPATALLACVAVISFSLCDRGKVVQEPDQPPTSTGRLYLTAIAAPVRDDYATPTPLPAARKIPLDNQPREPVSAVPAELVGTPFEFGPWDRTSALVYDLATGKTVDLGAAYTSNGNRPSGFGARVAFSRDSRYAAWIAPDQSQPTGRVWVMDLQSGERLAIAPGPQEGWIGFNDDGSLTLDRGSGRPGQTYNLQGTLVPVTPTPYPTVPSGALTDEYYVAPPGFRLFRTPHDLSAGSGNRFVLTDLQAEPLLEFDASDVRAAGSDIIVVSESHLADPGDQLSGTQNLYLVELPSGSVTFIATIARDHRVLANDDYVVWSEFMCTNPDRGTLHILERTTGIVRVIHRAMQGWLRDGNLFEVVVRDGDWNASYRVLFDLQTLDRKVVWRHSEPLQPSPDGRFVAPYLRVQGNGVCHI